MTFMFTNFMICVWEEFVKKIFANWSGKMNYFIII